MAAGSDHAPGSHRLIHPDKVRQVREAATIDAIAPSSAASNSASLCPAVSAEQWDVLALDG